MELKNNQIWDMISDIFYPNRCPCCNNFIKWNELLCESCAYETENTKDADFCQKCGRIPCICRNTLFYDRIYIYKPYHDIIKKGILSIKNGNNINFCKYCGIRLAQMIEKEQADMIIPVPMSSRKKRIRGYNQSEIIAKKIAQIKNIPLRNDILKMKYSRTEQHARKKDERNDIKKYLSIRDINLEGMKIIVCDDIITTANTINTCSELLKSKGAESIIAVLASGTADNKKITGSN